MKLKKLGALVASAVTMLALSGQASALGNNDIFLVAYDETAAKTFIANITNVTGTVSSFANSISANVNFSTDQNWIDFKTAVGADVVTYQVLGLNAVGNGAAYNANDSLVLTSTANPSPFRNGAMNTLVASSTSYAGSIGAFWSDNSTIASGATALISGGGNNSGANVKTNFFSQYTTANTAANIGTDLNFYSVTRPVGTTSLTSMVIAPFSAGTWNLSSLGSLTYSNVAAVPEASDLSMMVAGLGLIGFIARRRKTLA